MRLRYIWVAAAAILIFGFLLSLDTLARFAWQRYRIAVPALMFLRTDASLAMEIGNYHFNGSSSVQTAEGEGRAYDLDVAEMAFRKALRIDPQVQWGNHQLARVYFVRGEYDRALAVINRELAAWPENFRALYVRGLIEGYSGQFAAAERDFRRFTQYVPREWAGYNDLAWVLAAQGKHREAKERIAAALNEIPGATENPWLWNSLGAARLNLGEYPEAAQALRQARDLATALTPGDWQRVYPGNDPHQARSGMAAFQSAIGQNLRKAIELQFR